MESRRSFDVIGSIAIIEVPYGLPRKDAAAYEKNAGQLILAAHKNVKTVVARTGAHTGVFRLQRLKHLAGEKTKETTHKENGVMLKLDVGKVYFSPRLSGERLRVAGQVKPGEKILVMFSGCGPYPLVIARNSKAAEIVGVEINPAAHKYAMENAKLNKITNVRLLKGDAGKTVPRLKGKFDRIVMPLPKGAEEFLATAIKAARKGAVIHYYDFLPENDIPKAANKKIKDACLKAGRKARILNVVKCGQLAPRAYRVCVDFRVD